MYQKEIAEEKKGKVSIIIPIYNAEQYLGQTLSSVIRQTYHNIEILLINDGSTDGSLRICRNYEQLDQRIRIINIDNHGVSHARNKGIQEATGDYIQFVDSDDTISTHMTERLVDTLISYDTDMVICGMRSVHLADGKVEKHEDWTPSYLGKECILSKTEFEEDFSAILLYTVLLEGPCNKLYKKKFLTENNIIFPEDKNLGEDFILNLSYFKLLNSIAFISDILYFYFHRSQESLTERYHKNLFDNQIAMLREFKSFLIDEKIWSGNNINYFYQYAAGIISKCIHSLSKSIHLSEEQGIKSEIFRILNTKDAKRWIGKAGWIPENFEWIKHCVKHNDVGYAYDKLLEIHQQDIQKQNSTAQQNNIRYYPGKFNKCIDGFLKKSNLLLKSKKIEKLTESVENKGLKTTFASIIFSFKFKLRNFFNKNKNV
ncbi:MAG: glycosyltransferase family 2 protein [Lachnospiraceae bacterium]|nr:glycosyltransferase family 2 protein [Lachnospiraceae bacterium]